MCALPPELARLCADLPPADETAMAGALQRLDQLTKPQGSLGQLEPLLVRLAGATGQICPTFDQRAVLLAAADHGVAAEGVSAYPQSVTAQMVSNFLAGGAAINALATAANARIILVDAGVATDLPPHPQLRQLNLRRGSGNVMREPAMTPTEALTVLLTGAHITAEEHQRGLDLLVLGEMGIANTTPAAALTSALTGAPPEQTVGRGTGIDDQQLQHKQAVVQQALERVANTGIDLIHHTPETGLRLLNELGGLEIALLIGAILAAARRRIPVLLDGYITTSAALVAAALAPNVADYLFAAHRSAEPGHTLALAHLGLTADNGAGPLLQLDLRLGEGSGAALALPLLVAAAHTMRSMATFAEAGVANQKADEPVGQNNTRPPGNHA